MSESKPLQEFAFDKQNYLSLLIGVVIIILGFFLMSGGGSEDPNVFLGDYSLTEESFEKLSSEFEVSADVIGKLESIKGQVYPGEEELKAAMTELLGESTLQENYFELRSATHIDAAMFSTRRITIAPMIVLFGYGFIIYAILRRKKSTELVQSES